MRTWWFEMAVVALALSAVALARGELYEWLAAAAVLGTFGHASVAERMREREAARSTPAVDCHRMLWVYFVAKEIAWVLYFTVTHAYAALVGCAVFLAYPVWRRWWRARHPLDLEEPEVARTAPYRRVEP